MSFEGWVLVSLTAFSLFATSRIDLMRSADSRRPAIVVAILYDEFRFVAGTGKGTHADRIGFSALFFLLCCLAQSVIAELFFTLSSTATLLFRLRRRKRLLPAATEQYLQQAASKSVLSPIESGQP